MQNRGNEGQSVWTCYIFGRRYAAEDNMNIMKLVENDAVCPNPCSHYKFLRSEGRTSYTKGGQVGHQGITALKQEARGNLSLGHHHILMHFQT